MKKMFYSNLKNYTHAIQQIVGIGLLGIVSILSVNAQHNPWIQKADMPTARMYLSTSVVDSKIYAIGGCSSNGVPFEAVEQYDPATDTWTPRTPIPTARFALASSAVNGKIYVFGGNPGKDQLAYSTVEEYDPVTDTWTKKADMPTARSFLSTSVVNGKIYVIGGAPSSQHNGLNTVEMYDPVTDSWITKADMPTARCFLVTCVVNGKIYVIGGGLSAGSDIGYKTVEMYDPSTDSWTAKADMPTARTTNLMAVAVNDIIYVCGGAKSHSEVIATVEAYDPATDTWSSRTSMPMARTFFGTSVVNEKIYAIGGAVGDPWLGLSRVEEYNPKNDLIELIKNVYIDKYHLKPGNDSICILVKMNDTAGVTLSAEIESPDRTLLDSVKLFDDGNHNDRNMGDSLYANIWKTSSDEELQYYVDLRVTRIKSDTIIHEFDNVASFTTILPSSEPVAYWKLDETEGTTTSDAGKYNLDGELMYMDPSSWTGGISDGGLSFDGVDDYVKIPHSGALNFADQSFGISLWFKAGTLTGSSMYLVHKGAFSPSTVVGENGCWFGLEIKQNQLRFAIDDNIVKSVASKDGFSALLVNEWNHIAGVRDRSENKLRLYLNGEMIASTEDQTGSISEEVDMLLGNSFRYDAPLSGVLDEVKIFNYALSDSAVQDIYEVYAEVESSTKTVANELVLLRNYPNPFSQSTTIQFNLQESGFVTLKLFDFLGREVETLVSDFLNTGDHSVEFNAAGFPEGIYFCKLETGAIAVTKKMVLVR